MKDTNTIVSLRIKAVREDAGMTQEQFAAEIGIKRTSFAKLELGLKKPSVEIIQEVTKKFKVSYDYLMGTSDEQ